MNFERNSTDDELILKSLELKIQNSANDSNKKCSRNKNKNNFKSSSEDFHQEKILIIPQKIQVDCVVKTKKEKQKEPKFIPYEPYKACIKPILPTAKENLAMPKLDCDIYLKESSEPIESVISKNFVEENMNLVNTSNEMKLEIESLKKEIGTLNHLLGVQTQVNNDLKKLLVASLGEDVQEKINCLSEERARMAGMIRKYSEKVDSDYEEKERISINCDIWKSKFHASSLLIQEMAESKHELYENLKEANNAIRIMIDETNVISPMLLNCYKKIRQIQLAFDPLHSETAPSSSPTSFDILTLSSCLSVMADDVRNRLLGNFSNVDSAENTSLVSNYNTPGEKIANQVLRKCKGTINNYTRLPLVKKSVLPFQYHRDSHLTMNCCGHCNGDIILV